MGRCIAKLAEDEYVEWSTVVDAPVSWIMDRDQLAAHIQCRFGEVGLEDLDERLARCEKRGHSAFWPGAGDSIDDLIRGNHAAADGTELTLDQLRERYAAPPDEGSA